MKRKLLGFMLIGLMAFSLAACTSQDKPKGDDAGKKTETSQTENTKENEKEDAQDSLSELPQIAQMGTITSDDVSGNQIGIEVKGATEKDTQEIVLNVDENTPVVDAQTGMKVERSQLTKGTEVFAWVSNTFTASMPPQTTAYVILINVKDGVLPNYLEVDNIEKGESETILSDKPGAKWSVDNNLVPISLKDGKETTFDSIQKDSKCLVWPSNEQGKDGAIKVDKLLVLN